jgi:hypothetical protein
VLEEPLAHQVDQPAVLEWVGGSRRHLHDLGLVRRSRGRGLDHRRHHQVDRDHVDGALGQARELLQQAPGVRDDERLGHAEAADPARPGFLQRRLDDGRPHDRDRQVAPLHEQGPLAEGLGVGVDVGPAQRRGPGPARFDQLVLDPVLAALLGLGRQQRRAGGAQLAAGLLA